jgi:hypothetical protein
MKQFQNSNYRIILCAFLCICIPFFAMAQDDDEDKEQNTEVERNKVDFNLGGGLNFSLNDGNYQFNLGGFIQPSYSTTKTDGLDRENTYNSRRSYLQFSGNAVKEKVSFFLQLDYSLPEPLLDAWLAYKPFEYVTITFGQKQSFLNNREMMYREDRLQFTNRSFLSNNFSNTGREMGVFISSKFGDSFGISPMVAVTSGDGRNSFGATSRDADLGGIKYGGRLDLYPLGYFKDGNDLTSTDLLHEDKLKFVLGAAASKNIGASNATGEGHGNYILYDVNGLNNYPDYAQIYADILVKYQGFSLLAEYVNASASNIDIAYTDVAATTILAPTQISQFLALGDSFNLQAGYVTLGGLSFDVRYENTNPEFINNINSIIQKGNAFTFGLSKYFVGNSLKLQTSYTSVNPNNSLKTNQFDVLFQISF